MLTGNLMGFVHSSRCFLNTHTPNKALKSSLQTSRPALRGRNSRHFCSDSTLWGICDLILVPPHPSDCKSPVTDKHVSKMLLLLSVSNTTSSALDSFLKAALPFRLQQTLPCPQTIQISGPVSYLLS